MSSISPKIAEITGALSPANIIVPESFERMKYAGYYYLEIADPGGAAELSLKLESILEKVQPATAHDKYILSWIIFWMLRLRLFSFSSLTLGQQTDVFKKYAAQIAFFELDPISAAISYFDLFSGPKQADEGTKSYINALLSNTGIIGANRQEFQKRNFKATVASWISEYQAALSQRKVSVAPAAFDIVKFLDTNPNVRALSASEREQLRQILTFYNWLLSPIVYQEAVGAAFVIPKVEAPDAPQTPQAPPPVPMPKPAVAQKPIPVQNPAAVQKPAADIGAELEKLRQRKAKK